MPDIFDEIESPSRDIFDELEPVRDERGRKRVKLLGEQAAAAREGEAADAALSRWQTAESMVEPFTGRGIVNQPGRIMAALGGVSDTFEDPIQGPQIVIPEPKGDSALAGAGRLGARLLTGLTDPNMFVTLPAGASRLGLALFAGDLARHIPEQVERAAQVSGDIKSTPGAITEAVGEPVISAGMAGLIGRGAQMKPPRYISIEEQLKSPETYLAEDANRAAVNLASPGTVRPTEISAIGPPRVEVEAPKYTPPGTTVDIFNAGEVPFERMQRFGGQPLPPVEILPQSGRLPPVEILSEPRSLLERETRGKTSFGASAPTLVRNAQELPPALAEATARAAEMGLTKSAEAAAEVSRGTNAQEPYRAPKEFTPERAAEQERKAAKESVEAGMYLENPPMDPLAPDVAQFPEPPGMPAGTFSKLQRSRIQAGKENVRSNVSNNPPKPAEPTSPVETTEAAWQRGYESRTPEGVAKLETDLADATQTLKDAIANKQPTDAPLKAKQLAREALSVAKGETDNALANEWLAKRQAADDPVASLKAFKGTEGTAAAQDLGAKVTTREQLADLKKTHAEAEAAVMEKLRKAETDADLAAIADEQQRAALLKEAIEGAVGLGRGQKYDKTKLGNGNMQAALKEYSERMAGDTPIAMETSGPEAVTKGSEAATKVAPEVTEPPLTATPSSQALGIKASNPLIDLATDTILSGDWWKKHFTAAGSLPKAVHDKWVASRGKISSETKAIDYAKRDLYRGLRETFNISRGSELVGGMKAVPTAVVQDMNRALAGEIPVSSLPPKLQAPIQKMRDHIDKLSFDLIDKGLIDSDLAVKVGNNLGTYLTRSYRIFDDPKWVESIPTSIRQNAENYLWNELRRINPSTPIEVAQTKLRELLQDWSESGIDKQMRAGKLGSKDLTQFMKRGDVPPELRAVMGEYKDPVINYARSITKIARFIGDQEFLNFVKDDGLGKYLFPEGQSAPGFEAQLAADSSSTMSPLNGLRTSPLLKDAFENFQRGQKNENWAWQTYMKINALSKGAKTIGSWLTQARNIVGQPFFNLMSGDVGLNTPGNYAKAIKAIATDIGLKNDAAWRSYYQNLRERGIAHESARAEELRDALNDAGLKDTQISGIGETGPGTGARKVFLDAPARLYEISDEIGKIVGYENKKKLLREANPTWTPDQVETAAAERVRNTYPTYSKVPNAIKQLRRQPLWGPFISFPYEVFRTTFHSMRYAMQDAKSGNPVLQKQAAKQAAGMLTVMGSGYALSQASKALHGVSGDKEKDIRRFAPQWDKNAQLIFTGTDDDGAVKYVNWSYQNPYSYLTDPFVAFATSDEKNLFDRSVNSFGEFLRPFTSEQMLAATIHDVSRNKTQTGREIYNEQDDWDTKWRKSAQHVASAVEPGSVQRLRTKIIPAAGNTQPDYGRKLDLQTELTSELTGMKQQRLDFPQALKYKAREFSKQEDNAEHKFTGAVGRTGTVNNDELVQAYQEGDESRFKLWREMHLDVQAAIRNGVSEGEALRSLIDNGVAKREASLILQGTYLPKSISRNTVNSAIKFNRSLPMDQLRAYQEIRTAIPLK